MSIINQARSAVDNARSVLTAVLDVAQVPDGHHVERKVNAALITLEEALEALPKASRNASVLEHSGPMVRVTPQKDIREWYTTGGEKISKHLNPNETSRFARARGRLQASKRFAARRVLSKQEYLNALEESTHSLPSYKDSYTYVSLKN